MPLVTIQNRLSSRYSVPAPVSRTLAAGQSITVRLSSSDLENSDLGAEATAGRVSLSVANDPATPDSVESAVMSVVQGTIRDVSLSAAAEAADAIVVSGQVVDGAGTAVAAIADVLVEVFAPTIGEGDITVTSGTAQVNLASGAGNIARCWLKTTAGGAFAVSVADAAAESVLVKATADNGACSLLTLTFAA